MLKSTIYKIYVLMLIALVIWVAQFIYPLIFWEFEHTGNNDGNVLRGNESSLESMRKVRLNLDENTVINKINLNDKTFDEKYVKKHFHHIGSKLEAPVVNGCDHCHTVLPHQEDEEIRAFLNMHGYYMACETCHVTGKKDGEVAYRWLKNVTLDPIKKPLQLLKDKLVTGIDNGVIRGDYDARIVPYYKESDDVMSVLDLSDVDDARSLLEGASEISGTEQTRRVDGMHEHLDKKPLECDACHTEDNAVFPYADLGYPRIRANELMDTAIVGMISKYEQFHFPNLFIRKDDRKIDYLEE